MKKKINKKAIPNHPIFTQLGIALKAMREKKGLTQAEVAKKVKVHAQFVSNWERGLCAPPLRSLKALRNIYRLGPKGKEVLAKALLTDFSKRVTTDFKELIG